MNFICIFFSSLQMLNQIVENTMNLNDQLIRLAITWRKKTFTLFISTKTVWIRKCVIVSFYYDQQISQFFREKKTHLSRQTINVLWPLKFSSHLSIDVFEGFLYLMSHFLFVNEHLTLSGNYMALAHAQAGCKRLIWNEEN